MLHQKEAQTLMIEGVHLKKTSIQGWVFSGPNTRHWTDHSVWLSFGLSVLQASQQQQQQEQCQRACQRNHQQIRPIGQALQQP